MHTRPMPSGRHHFIDVTLKHLPLERYVDPVRALDDMSTGLSQPLVEVIDESTAEGCVVRVSLFSDAEVPPRDEVAAIAGTAAELRLFDTSR